MSFMKPFDIMNHTYICCATIKGLVPNDKWWYLACTACKRKSIPHGDTYRCTNCHNKTAKPRYKLAVEATDDTTHDATHDTTKDTPTIEFIFFGDVAEQLVTRIHQNPPLLIPPHHSSDITAAISSSSQILHHQYPTEQPEPTIPITQDQTTTIIQNVTPTVSPTQLPTVQVSDIHLRLQHDTRQQPLSHKDKEIDQTIESTKPHSNIPLAHHAQPFTLKIASTEQPKLTPSSKKEKELSDEESTPPEKEDIPQRQTSKRRTTSRTISKTARKLFKDDASKAIGKE